MTNTVKPFNGLNGTIMLNTFEGLRLGKGTGRATGLGVGSTPGGPYGYKRSLKVTVDIRMEQVEGAHETTEHVTIASPLDFAITANVWQPSEKDVVATGQVGQTLDLLDSYTYGEDLVRFLKEAAEKWHLNTMRAGCAHQEVPDIPEDVPALDRTGWLLDNTPPCPKTGYRYGRKWLVEPLTDEFVRDLLGALAEPIENRRVYVHEDLPRLAGVEEPLS